MAEDGVNDAQLKIFNEALAALETLNYNDMDTFLERYADVMKVIAPNVSAVVGSAVAAKLIGSAGGLASLAKMPACNIQLLGAKRKNLAGFSTATSQDGVAYIDQIEIVQTTPPSLKMFASRLLVGKLILAARVDVYRGDPSGNTGKRYWERIRKKIVKFSSYTCAG